LRDDFREGLTISLCKAAEPQFKKNKNKLNLGNREVVSPVSQAVGDMIESLFGGKSNDARIIVQKVILAARRVMQLRKRDEMVQRKTVWVAVDCQVSLFRARSSKMRSIPVEGGSAGGTAKQGRDRAFQAILPYVVNFERGKAMHRHLKTKRFEIFTAWVGGTAEDSKALNIENLRYHKVVYV
jgi:DNA gyrase subunit B